ncbi:hypothetical protein T484DRAFT_1935871, partial [Baffinella frigidus]
MAGHQLGADVEAVIARGDSLEDLSECVNRATSAFQQRLEALAPGSVAAGCIEQLCAQGRLKMEAQREAAVRRAVEEGGMRTLGAIEALPCNTADLFGLDFDRARDAGSQQLGEALEGLGGVAKGAVEQSVGEFVRTVDGAREGAVTRNMKQLAGIETACTGEVAAAVARMEAVSIEDPRQIRAALEQEQEIVVEKLRSMTAVKAIAQQHSKHVVEAAQGILASKIKEWVQDQSDSTVTEFNLAAGKLPVAFPADFDAAYQELLGS